MIDVKRLEVDAGYWDECAAPDGATHAIPKRGYDATGVVWFKRVSESDWKVWSRYDTGSFLRWCDSAGTSDGPHFIPRPQPQPEWVGGLPPEGVGCEMADAIGRFIEVHIIANFDGYAFGWSYDQQQVYFSKEPKEFRPIFTPEQRQRDELTDLIYGALNKNIYMEDCEAVIEAILSRYTLEPKST